MNILVVVAPDYSDMDSVRRRLFRGSTLPHTAYRRKGDRTVKSLATELGIEIPVAVSEWVEVPNELHEESFAGPDFPVDGSRIEPQVVNMGDEAYANEMLNRMDRIIVYATKGSTVTKFYVDKATKPPYSHIYGSKVEINVVEDAPEPVKKLKATRRSE